MAQRGHGSVQTGVAVALLAAATPMILRKLREVFFPVGKPLQRRPKLARKLRVAILGAGVGGSALARWLRDLYGEDVELTIVSDGPIGGRIQSVEAADGRNYEGGAAIISELNQYMLGFMGRLKLKERKKVDTPMGVYDGMRLLVREADPLAPPLGLRFLAALQSAWRLISRYGFWGLRKLTGLMTHPAAPRFPPLYRALAKGEAFATPEALLKGLGPQCQKLTQEVAQDWLVSEAPAGGGLPRNIITELVTGGMRSNYGGQGCASLHAFVGLVSIAGGFASRCFAIQGGNQQVPRGLVDSAQPDRVLTDTTARTVRRGAEANTWEVLVAKNTPGEAMKGPSPAWPAGDLTVEGPFDVVAVAHPLERSCLKFEGLPKDPKPQGSFRRCVTHFVHGVLRREVFSPGETGRGSAPMAVLTPAESIVPFYSIGLQLPVDSSNRHEPQKLADAALKGEPAVFKVFAPEVLSDAQLDELFAKRQGQTKVLDWYAYPEYSVPQPLMPFVLDADTGIGGSLLYLNAIEQTASAMEMSAVSARNAANLIVSYVERQPWRVA